MKKPRIVYKVVGKGHRYGSNVTGWLFDSKCCVLNDFLKKEKLSELKPYLLKYQKNKIVSAVKGSVGILCFKTKDFAQDFIDDECDDKYFKIIKVEGIGKAKCSGRLIMSCMSNIEYLVRENQETRSFPNGSITFPKVKVLE